MSPAAQEVAVVLFSPPVIALCFGFVALVRRAVS